MKLSVIIVNYNVRHFLEQCLHAAMKASEGLECELFVVDNASVDGSCPMVREKFHEVFGSECTLRDDVLMKRYNLSPDGELIMFIR